MPVKKRNVEGSIPVDVHSPSRLKKKLPRLVARGLNNAAIASQLSLSERTVRNHVSIILSELNVTDRTQAAVIVIQHGLVVADRH